MKTKITVYYAYFYSLIKYSMLLQRNSKESQDIFTINKILRLVSNKVVVLLLTLIHCHKQLFVESCVHHSWEPGREIFCYTQFTGYLSWERVLYLRVSLIATNLNQFKISNISTLKKINFKSLLSGKSYYDILDFFRDKEFLVSLFLSLCINYSIVMLLFFIVNCYWLSICFQVHLICVFM